MPPKGFTLIDPVVAHVASVTTKLASTPAITLREATIPHLGEMLGGIMVGHVLFGEASVHASHILISSNDWPHKYERFP